MAILQHPEEMNGIATGRVDPALRLGWNQCLLFGKDDESDSGRQLRLVDFEPPLHVPYTAYVKMSLRKR